MSTWLTMPKVSIKIICLFMISNLRRVLYREVKFPTKIFNCFYLDRRSWLSHTCYFNYRWSAQIVHTFFNRVFLPGVSHMICTKRAQAGFPEFPGPARTKLIPWTSNLYPANRGFFLARVMCGVVRVAIIRVVGLFTSPNENADGNFSVVEMRRL